LCVYLSIQQSSFARLPSPSRMTSSELPQSHTSGVVNYTSIASPIAPYERPSEPLTPFSNNADSSWIPPPIDPGYLTNNMIVCIHRASTCTGYLFRCCAPECNGRTFNRWGDFERHDNSFHLVRPKLWCPISQCKRSECGGNKGFPAARKDKLMEHVRKKHGAEYAGLVGSNL
jgi:hypothetical protein